MTERSEGTLDAVTERSEGTLDAVTERSEGTLDAVTERSEGTLDAVTERSEGTLDAVTERSETEGTNAEARRALFRIVRGTPSDAEVVALALVLAASPGSDDDDAAPRERDRWSDPAAGLRTALQPGPGAWRSTYWPR